MEKLLAIAAVAATSFVCGATPAQANNAAYCSQAFSSFDLKMNAAHAKNRQFINQWNSNARNYPLMMLNYTDAAKLHINSISNEMKTALQSSGLEPNCEDKDFTQSQLLALKSHLTKYQSDLNEIKFLSLKGLMGGSY